jgi:hypothetical protein
MGGSANTARTEALTTESSRRNRRANRRSGPRTTISARRCGRTDRAVHERRAIAFLQLERGVMCRAVSSYHPIRTAFVTLNASGGQNAKFASR